MNRVFRTIRSLRVVWRVKKVVKASVFFLLIVVSKYCYDSSFYFWYPYPEGKPPSQDFRYITRNEHLCSSQDTTPQIFIAIVSTPSNYHRRNLIRKTYGSTGLWRSTDFMKIGFLLGSTGDNKTQQDINEENSLHSDIIQQDFHDSYRNLTYKAVMFLHWTIHYCNSARWVLKVDDDVMLDVFQLLQTLDMLHVSKNRLIICNLSEFAKVVREGDEKWRVDESVLKSRFYPPYCPGGAVVFSPEVLHDLYQASFYVPFISVDDAYVTGYLVQYAGNISLIHEPTICLNGHNKSLSYYNERHVMKASLPEIEIFEDAWWYIACRNARLQRHLLSSVYKSHTADIDNCLRRHNLSISFNNHSFIYKAFRYIQKQFTYC